VFALEKGVGCVRAQRELRSRRACVREGRGLALEKGVFGVREGRALREGRTWFALEKGVICVREGRV